MTKRELIDKLESLNVPDDMEVCMCISGYDDDPFTRSDIYDVSVNKYRLSSYYVELYG